MDASFFEPIVSAHAHGDGVGHLKLSTTSHCFIGDTATFSMGDLALARKLADAINRVIAEHRAERPAEFIPLAAE